MLLCVCVSEGWGFPGSVQLNVRRLFLVGVSAFYFPPTVSPILGTGSGPRAIENLRSVLNRSIKNGCKAGRARKTTSSYRW